MTNEKASANMLSKSLKTSLEKAAKKIAPLWPLESFVAVNPYLGMSHLTFQQAAQRLDKVGGGHMTLPTEFYLRALENDEVRRADVKAVLERTEALKSQRVENFLYQINSDTLEDPKALPAVSSLTDVATATTQRDWNQWTVDMLSSWASVYFDQGQIAWNPTQGEQSLYKAWRSEAIVNRTPDIHGLAAFRKEAKQLPEEPLEAAHYALNILGLPSVGIELYLHRLQTRILGWSSYIGYLDYQQQLYQKTEGAAQIEWLAVLLSTEALLLQSLMHTEVPQAWEGMRAQLMQLGVEDNENDLLTERLVLQEAYDLAAQRRIIEQFPSEIPLYKSPTPKAQAVFCIDVRSEVYRRHLEHASSEIDTLGFAGFFAFPIKYQPIGHSHGRAQCPVLLPAGPTIQEALTDTKAQKKAEERRTVQQHLGKSWKAFKKSAVSCFGYVSPVGLSFLPKLISDSLGLTRPVAHPDQKGLTRKEQGQKTVALEHSAHGMPFDQQVDLAHNALRAMSLTEDFGRLVLIVGHGAHTVNNPHATGLDCGACGGNAGEANARVAATVLNDRLVREQLAHRDIQIPDTTWFLACQHDTTTDDVSIFETQKVPVTHQGDLKEVQGWLEEASRNARAERAVRLGIDRNADQAVKARSKDWAQVRPEWGLAGCHAFVVAPRKRTYGLNLEGKSFLHSYLWQQDEGFKVLELIMTAPMIVTSWINLQYYASTVDNQRYGAGNKTLHNVTAGLGVLEGSAGDLRTGLPWQSVHDGKNFQHTPVRLNVIIEAPTEAMTDILSRHSEVRQLLDNEWIFLWAMNEEGRVAHRYRGSLEWEPVETMAHA